ncbi:MAG: SGNH/GDSL hydrolase family protein, partial [Verrucomicrobiota bacterium]
MNRVLPLSALIAGCLIQQGLAAAPQSLDLNPGSHIALVGSALADRMQHDGHFEALLYAQFPKQNIVVRNLAVAGDEVAIRHRSENFGSPDEWLKKVGADVILAFFGFNESFKGPEGVAAFKTNLDRWVKETQAKNYSGKGGPRLVLVSPVGAERHKDPNFPDPAPLNANLKLYTEAMAEVAKANDVQFVDLFDPSLKLYADAAKKGQSLTINGFLLSEAGDRALAPVLFQSLFGKTAPCGNRERLRAAINEKHAQWHARYRTV